MNKIIWRHFSLQIPADWEMLLFSRDMKSGYCTFADRYQHRMEFNWKQVPGKPDWEKMWQEYSASFGQVSSDRLTRCQHGKWTGLDIQGEKSAISRYGGWFTGEQCLIEIVFLWPDQPDRQLIRQVLDSVAEVPADARGFRPWRAFGMQLLASSNLVLKLCVAQPGNIHMVFTHARDAGCEERFERIGLVSCWLRGSVEDWMRRRRPRSVSIRQLQSTTVEDHMIMTLHGSRSRDGWQRFLGRRRSYYAQAWICPRDEHLYSYMITEAAGKADAERLRNRLVCCDHMRMAV